MATETGACGAALIVAERIRQQTQEGWNAGHDAEHDGDELVRAAVCYIANAVLANRGPATGGKVDGAWRTFGEAVAVDFPVPEAWPWGEQWWKPHDKTPLRRLVVAGALIAAEIDRRLRTGESVESVSGES